MPITRRNFIIGTGASAIAAPGVVNMLSESTGLETHIDRGESLWTKTLPEPEKFESFAGKEQADLVIVGGGYTGLACAYYAKKFKPGWRVIVLEAQRIGSGSSSRNSGAVYAKYTGMNNVGFAERGLQRLTNFIDHLNIDCDFQPASTLFLHPSKGAASRARKSLEPGATWLSGSQLSDLAGTSYYAGAINSPGYFKIDPAKLLLGKTRAALSVGVEIFEHSAVTKIDHATPASVTTSNGVLTAKNVFIATNGYTPRLGMFNYTMFPLHQFTLATRKLSISETQMLGLQHFDLRFEPRILPVTFSLMPSGSFFMRMVLGYAHNDSSHWKDSSSALELAKKMFLQRYPSVADIGFDHHWHGITGHTITQEPIMGVIGEGNVHVSVAYNGLGIMPSHNNGYLSACKMTGQSDRDLSVLETIDNQIPVPRGYYRSILLKPGLSSLIPV